MYGLAASILTILWLYCFIKQASKWKGKKLSRRQLLIQTPGESLYYLLKLDVRLVHFIHHLHAKLLILHRHEWSYDKTVERVNLVIGQAFLVIIGSAWLTVLRQDWSFVLLGLVVAIILLVRCFVEATKQLALRKQAILLELPMMLIRLILLVGAGDTVQQAFLRAIAGKEQSAHPLHKEWNIAVHELRNGASFTQVLEKFNRNCSVQQVAMFTTILLLNYRRGGEQFIIATQELSHSLWETRKSLAKIKGEEASSKLIFPLVGVLFSLMVLIVAPAIMLMRFF